ncbi:hypothetical protein [Azotosporobacter soli]|uniref:hypothetical protein n=1 Tax=Azotosporobacter soli TaxID=3055040 RepID=UPI0031FE4DF1
MSRQRQIAKKAQSKKPQATDEPRSFKQTIDEMEPMPLWAKIVVVILLAGLAYKFY